MKLGVYANLDKPGVIPALTKLNEAAAERGITLLTTGETASLMAEVPALPLDEFRRTCDFLLTLGGDGTLLSAVQLIDGADLPILGVNLGKLGFLTAARDDQIPEALDALLNQDFFLSERIVARCEEHRAGSPPRIHHALNDVVMSWGASTRVAQLQVAINGEPVTTFTCDGIILATPTGSTGHSLSAGGPILHPKAGGMVISVICPHTMSARPVVVPDNRSIEVTVGEASKDLMLSVDGRPEGEMRSGDRVVVQRATRKAKLIFLPGYSYFNVLRNKLNWRGSAIHE